MRAVLLLLGCASIGCGATADPHGSGGAGGDVSSGGTKPVGGNAGASAGLGGGPTMAGAAGSGGMLASGGNAGSAGGGLEGQPLLPLVPGHVSSFVFTPIDAQKPMTDTCAEPTTSLESGAGLSFDGHVGTLYRTFCAPEPFLIEGSGDDLTAYEIKAGAIVPPARNYIHSPVETGEMWDSGIGDKYTWEEVSEPVETAAGTFHACFHRLGTDTRITYCRGVGVVQALADYGNYRLELVAKNF